MQGEATEERTNRTAGMRELTIEEMQMVLGGQGDSGGDGEAYRARYLD